MRSKATIVSLLLTVTLICAPLVTAQQPGAPGDWSVVQGLPSGEEVDITLKDGKSVKGKVTSVTSDELVKMLRGAGYQPFNVQTGQVDDSVWTSSGLSPRRRPATRPTRASRWRLSVHPVRNSAPDEHRTRRRDVS